ncbi:MAG: zf-HC2 domain-containing protein [Chthonomonadales bacterium]
MSSYNPIQEPHRFEEGDTCERMWLLLSVYADGEATDEERAEVEAHVAQCRECSEALEMMQASSMALASVAEVEPPAELRASILAATVNRPSLAERVAQLLRVQPAFRQMRYAALAGAGAAAAIALTVLVRRPAPMTLRAVLTNRPPVIISEAPAQPAQPHRVAVAPKPLNRVRVASSTATPLRPVAPRNLVVARVVEREAARDRRLVPAAATSKHAVALPKVASAAGSLRVKPVLAGPHHPAVAEPNVTETDTVEMASATVTPVPDKLEPASVATPDVARRTSDTTHITLTASASGIPVDQIASLATIKQNLRRQRPNWDTPDVSQSIKDRQIRIDLIRGTF